MLHCPNEARPEHAEPESTSFFVEALMRVGNDWLIRDYVMFLPNPYACGDCGAQAFDDEEDLTIESRDDDPIVHR